MIPLPKNSHILADAGAVARTAAERLGSLCAATPDRPIAVCLSGGSTPKRLYTLLAGAAHRETLPWDRLHWFFGDDRHVPWDDAVSNVRMAREAFSGAPIPPGNVHGMPMSHALAADAAAYEAELKAFYGAETLDPERPLFDLVLLGLGEDGHTASLFPGKPAVEETRAWVSPVPEAGLDPFVPRLTLTFPVLASARSVLMLVTGEAKRAPLQRLADGEDLPAARIAGPVTWLVDRAAADADSASA